MFAALDALVVEVVAERPAFLDEDVAELLDVGDDARAFFCADVEPDCGMRVDARGGGVPAVRRFSSSRACRSLASRGSRRSTAVASAVCRAA